MPLGLSTRADVHRSRLSADLADAERYREAYHNLLDEVGVLAARNQLAESEATRISQFNAEILGHNNPAQRIVYLDRVRRELAETKQVSSFVWRPYVARRVSCGPPAHTHRRTWILIPWFVPLF
jgi:hypothetical protein